MSTSNFEFQILLNIYLYLDELLYWLAPLNSINKIKSNSPSTNSTRIGEFMEIAETFMSEVVVLRKHAKQRIDLASPEDAAAQFRQLALGWNKYEIFLSDSIRRMGIPELEGDKSSSEIFGTLSNTLQGIKETLYLISMVNAQSLSSHRNIGDMIELRQLMFAKLQRLLHGLTHCLSPIESLCKIKDDFPQTTSEQIDNIGKIAGQLINEVIDLREHALERIRISSPKDAVNQIRQLAIDWRKYEYLLLDAIQKVSVSDAKTGDDSLDRIIDALPKMLEEVKQNLDFLEQVDSEYLIRPLNDGREAELGH